MRREDIKRIFGRFAGRQVTAVNAVPAAEDPVVREMAAEAKKHALVLRLLWPGNSESNNWRTDRVNVHLEQDIDGKWRVSGRFGLG